MEREVRDPRASGMGMDHGHSSRQAQQWPNPGQMRCRVYGTGCRLWGTGYRMQGAEYGVQGCEVQAVGCRSSQGAWVSMPHGRLVALGQGGNTQRCTELAHSSAPCRVEGVLVPGL